MHMYFHIHMYKKCAQVRLHISDYFHLYFSRDSKLGIVNSQQRDAVKKFVLVLFLCRKHHVS